MAGHSQFANIKHRKGAQDKKKAKLFTKLIREILTAAKQGMPDPAHNPRLRSAMIAARTANMPKDRIEEAIKKASGAGNAENYDEMRYEGYGPGGIAVIVEALTDNRNRTASEVRAAFTKNGGNMGESGSVSFMFKHVGLVTYPAAKASTDAMMEAAIEAGAEDCTSDDLFHHITCSPDDFSAVRDALIAKLGDPEEAKLTWQAVNAIPVEGEKAETLLELVEALEDNDDVQQVITNAA